MATDKIFFSYSRKDSGFVLKLAKDLRDAGVEIWLDELEIPIGTPWDSSVEAALKSARNMIVILSPSSVESKNVMDEVSYALENGKGIIPVLMSECTIPLRLGRLQWIDFTEDYQTGLGKLIIYLEGLSGTDEKTPNETDEKKSKIHDTKETPVIEQNKSKAEVKNKDEKLERLVWEKAIKQDTLNAYNHYIKEYPNGKYKDDASAKVKQLKEIQKELETTRKRNSKKYLFILGGLLIAVVIVVLGIFWSNQNAEKAKLAEQARQKSIQEKAAKDAHDKRMKEVFLGNIFEGGEIFYIDETGQHGLIMAQADVKTNKMKWFYGPGRPPKAGAYGTGIYDGKKNTKEIVEKFGPGEYPAKLCDDLVEENYSDWYLPSQEELDKLYEYNNHNGFSNEYYWSSTEIPDEDVYYRSFHTGISYTSLPKQNSYNDQNLAKVRAIRSF